MQVLTFQKKINYILEKIAEYNKINNDIKRFGIFNSFNIFHEIDGENLYFDMKNTDDEGGISLASIISEQWIQINTSLDNEINWLIKTINRFIEKAKESMKKARELAKPHVGILIYDEFTDSYYLNPITGPILLRSKEIAKEISSTRIDIFNIFINLKSIFLEDHQLGEIIGKSSEFIIEKIHKSLKFIKESELKLARIEGIPRYVANLIQNNDKLLFNSYATVDFGLEIIKINKVNEVLIEAEKLKIDQLEKIYLQVRRDEEVSKIMIDLARSLISKNDPKMYFQEGSSGLWFLSKEGKKTIQNLNIIDFIDNDINEINFEIN
ncbi:hypothetical protein [Spiroplasma taiwanense]|uniref:Uncharacterized protein n=1 Tax=Spiroplasma taiwanense CT-1 TaxID=1276220 RepID=S5LTS8_9MOLU|nr:hypothetical protein [Spiroplasma taiwanense]AGR41119.1 hypothetical protein STAIW_v1c04770 [Spiroplasma taiwanense CT-1]